MMMKPSSVVSAALVALAAVVQISGGTSVSVSAAAQAMQGPPPPGPDRGGGFGGGRFGGARPPLALVEKFDADKNKRLDSAERRAALEYVKTTGTGQRGRGRGFGAQMGPAAPGARVSPAQVKPVPASVPFYDQNTLRTLFIDFPDADWEQQMEAFKETDIEVPATLTVDGRAYPDVDFSFRGASSFMMVPEGRKRSINVTLDNVHGNQNIQGYNSLNLLNSHTDPTFLRSVLYLQIARDYLPAAKANWVRVVINGEDWGVYVNLQQVDKPFLAERFKTKNGTRWKVPGSPNGRGGLEYLGADVAAYKQIYEIKGDDSAKAWAQLVELTRVLNQTPAESLEQALAPIMDVDSVLRFLAVEAALVNNDGYWTRASDYNIYLDTKGRFHVMPHDTNETFPTAGGGGGFGGRGGGGRGFGRGGDATLDPLVGLDDVSKPLRSRLLAVPALRSRYLGYVRDVATKWLDWQVLERIARQSQALIGPAVKVDTKRLDDFASFEGGLEGLRTFVEARRKVLLAAPALTAVLR
jgi:hypothetical protein